MTEYDFTGKTILVTGASSGLGEACAKYFDRCGADTILIARRTDKLEKIIKTFINRALIYGCDLSCIDNIKGIFDFLAEHDKKLDGVVHAAGVAPNIPILGFQYEAALDVFRINFFSFCEILKYCAKRKYVNNGASIVGVSSISVKKGNKAQGIYVASKAAMEGYIRIAAKELAGKKIRVNAIEPAGMLTEMAEQAFQESEAYRAYSETVHKFGFIEPDELCKVIAFLLSDMSKYMSGLTLPVDSGLLYCSGEF